jgi:hypothetical protein
MVYSLSEYLHRVYRRHGDETIMDVLLLERGADATTMALYSFIDTWRGG